MFVKYNVLFGNLWIWREQTMQGIESKIIRLCKLFQIIFQFFY